MANRLEGKKRRGSGSLYSRRYHVVGAPLLSGVVGQLPSDQERDALLSKLFPCDLADGGQGLERVFGKCGGGAERELLHANTDQRGHFVFTHNRSRRHDYFLTYCHFFLILFFNFFPGRIVLFSKSACNSRRSRRTRCCEDRTSCR